MACTVLLYSRVILRLSRLTVRSPQPRDGYNEGVGANVRTGKAEFNEMRVW